MAYITATELSQAIGFQAATMMATFTATETDTQQELFEAMLDGMIDAAGDLIDAMIGIKYDVSEYTGNAILKRICLMISRYDVYCQYARFDVPETVRLDKEAAMKDLEKIQQGKLELAADDATFDADDMSSEFDGSDQYLTINL
jgi:phage gp36-like protein